jgi:hypothetical protein
MCILIWIKSGPKRVVELRLKYFLSSYGLLDCRCSYSSHLVTRELYGKTTMANVE